MIAKPFLNGEIMGVVVAETQAYRDARGSLTEAFREDELPGGHRPVMGYLSWTQPGMVRGPHEHKEQADFFVFIGPSDFRLTMWDNRKMSKTYWHQQEMIVGASHPVSVRVPKGVVHAYQNIGKEPGLSLNFPDRLYAGKGKQEPVDEIRHEADLNTPFKVQGSEDRIQGTGDKGRQIAL